MSRVSNRSCNEYIKLLDSSDCDEHTRITFLSRHGLNPTVLEIPVLSLCMTLKDPVDHVEPYGLIAIPAASKIRTRNHCAYKLEGPSLGATVSESLIAFGCSFGPREKPARTRRKPQLEFKKL